MKTMFRVHVCTSLPPTLPLRKAEVMDGKILAEMPNSCDIFRNNSCIYISMCVSLPSIYEENPPLGYLFNL
jgi:hypothetical protein